MVNLPERGWNGMDMDPRIGLNFPQRGHIPLPGRRVALRCMIIGEDERILIRQLRCACYALRRFPPFREWIETSLLKGGVVNRHFPVGEEGRSGEPGAFPLKGPLIIFVGSGEGLVGNAGWVFSELIEGHSG